MSCPSWSARSTENEAYSIFLHIVEGIGLRNKESFGDVTARLAKIVIYASLNGVRFEVEGQQTENATVFKSNCIWDCNLDDLKRMKTDNRPVKIECFMKFGSSGNLTHKQVGTLLLPMRAIPVIHSLQNFQPKMLWHKLYATAPELRPNKPEICLMLIIIKKALTENQQFEDLLVQKHPLPLVNGAPGFGVETSNMLQSQNNVYVQLLDNQGVIQVGNNPDVDCDTFTVSVVLKSLKNVARLLPDEDSQGQAFLFYYEILGSPCHVDLVHQDNDSFAINEKITLTFRTSIKSLRMYFDRIFYIPINLYKDGHAVASYHFDCGKYFPLDDAYFEDRHDWKKNGVFYFDRLHKILSPRAKKPAVDFVLVVHRQTCHAKKPTHELVPLRNTFIAMGDSRAGGDCRSRASETLQTKKQETSARSSVVSQPSAKRLSGEKCNKDVDRLNMLERFIKDARILQQNLNIDDILNQVPAPSALPGTKTLRDCASNTESDRFTKSIGVNTEPAFEQKPASLDTDELALKIVEELEAWKVQQMELFLTELERKEAKYMGKLEENWQSQRAILQARLEAKIAECEKMSVQLEHANSELRNRGDRGPDKASASYSARRNIESNYERKFQVLEGEMQRLRSEMQHKTIENEVQTRELQLEVKKLEGEKSNLHERIQQLETQLQGIQRTYYSPDQIKEMVNDLRLQAARFADIEKSKEFYKEQWTKTSNEIHKLKLFIIREQEKRMLNVSNNTADEAGKCLKEILSDEKNALNIDRCELNDIKEMLLVSSETSCHSSCSSVCDNASFLQEPPLDLNRTQ